MGCIEKYFFKKLDSMLKPLDRHLFKMIPFEESGQKKQIEWGFGNTKFVEFYPDTFIPVILVESSSPDLPKYFSKINDNCKMAIDFMLHKKAEPKQLLNVLSLCSSRGILVIKIIGNQIDNILPLLIDRL